MAQLAIKGHNTRGKEVIALLEMLGGINAHNLYGDESYAYYTIDSDKEIKGGIYVFGDEQLCHFTLEEFEEKFPYYKIGDKVKYNNNIFHIKSSQWDSEKNTVIYYIDADWSAGYVVETSNLQPYKEKTMVQDIVIRAEFLIKDLEKCIFVNNNFNPSIIKAWKDVVRLCVESGSENHDIIYDFNEQNDLIACIQMGMDAEDISNLVNRYKLYKEITPYFKFNNKRITPYNLTKQDVINSITELIDSIAYNTLKYPYENAYIDLYKEFVVQYIDSQR